MTTLHETCEQWTSQSPEFYLYIALLSESKKSLECFMDSSMVIFGKCCDASRDPEMRQKMLILMSQVMLASKEDNELIKQFRSHALKLIHNSVLPNCVWKAGRTAAVVRSVAVSFFWAMLESHVVTDAHLSQCFKEVHTQVLACLDDHNETTRLVTIKVILKLLLVCGASFDVDQLHVIYPEVLKRMDDSSDQIRILTTKTLSAFFKSLPTNYDREFYRVHLEFIFRTLLVHMDDSHKDVQEAVFNCLKDGLIIHPGLLKIQVEDVVNKHHRKTFCEELIKMCDAQIRES